MKPIKPPIDLPHFFPLPPRLRGLAAVTALAALCAGCSSETHSPTARPFVSITSFYVKSEHRQQYVQSIGQLDKTELDVDGLLESFLLAPTSNGSGKPYKRVRVWQTRRHYIDHLSNRQRSASVPLTNYLFRNPIEETFISPEIDG